MTLHPQGQTKGPPREDCQAVPEAGYIFYTENNERE